MDETDAEHELITAADELNSLTVEALARKLGVSQRTVYRRKAAGSSAYWEWLVNVVGERREQLVNLSGEVLPVPMLPLIDTSVFTYVIGFQAPGPQDIVKIGRAVSIKARIAQLQTASPWRLELIGFVDADVEDKLHEHFGHARMEGEWFCIPGVRTWLSLGITISPAAGAEL